MGRAGKIKKRVIEPDPIFGNRLLNRFINRVMLSGKKSVAQKQVYNALDKIKSKKLDPLEVFQSALNNVSPRMEVKSRRVGGASYQVPTEVRGDRKISLSIRWLIEAANKRSNKEYHTFSDKLAAELVDAYNNTGEAVRKKDLSHRMAEANKAFSHFRW
ncbi:30S ribosomal protein S7 [Candidatus Gottesmanbacteria bacterium RIFCSPHIGHO2_02_FULL_40_24]|uniref:Small ribosomal subunit protein uS7 n=1 Tax=Candidatus Gottesmanbacteria bacterium RIFCSPHIGHO2_01_FULL_40_15 TaxID=1798376 RepID=A0A1F5Z6I7_9BACT|nr:MAG: 30S ribosomal protein S7 [Candidatus Gottesmanbacteria bacterium RIFCSPHIGHO2_01_FULL_40_15]OGG18208.1 MAG: 30S ribosomal protein S7 [Candidatus Gottesmanbacteria bacterium RIFCSPHIGHO2_02_FULL_40_24]OGG23492.1 MAG: 30S ribosomal protein S7 [Candidatus Gottesmanbacteria bacterium RIFCSPHIGHO2_12_FULL_40_13]OGG32507.1 MAG: 30S ribosomal protein S7 [Candidatus Gottesmanbacteria bacterium RIFCSPLOWO2_02_FULL_40_10]